MWTWKRLILVNSWNVSIFKMRLKVRVDSKVDKPLWSLLDTRKTARFSAPMHNVGLNLIKITQAFLSPRDTVYVLGQLTLSYFLALVSLIPSLMFWTEIESTVHVDLPKRPINQFKPVHQSRQQALKTYCPNIYCVWPM